MGSPDQRSAGMPRGDLVDIERIATRLGVEVRHVRRLVHERRIPYVKWGRLLRFDPAEIDAWIDTARVPAEISPKLSSRSSPLTDGLPLGDPVACICKEVAAL